MTEENRTRKRTLNVCTISCEWENCESNVTLLPAEYDTFSDHLKVHADEFVLRLKTEADKTDEKQIHYCCMWRVCPWEGCEDLSDLIRHIMFHGYHALLKALGTLVQTRLKLNECTIEFDDQYHAISCVETPFICKWKECLTEFFCPNKFYRHVERHVMESDGVYDDKNHVRTQCCWNGCSNTFRDKHKLKEHVRVHTHEKLFACPGCGGLFSNRTKLLDHLSRQNTEAYENFQCSHCLKRCASERLLRDHMRHHVNYLKCPHCDMTCPNPGSLKYHIHYRHSNNRPFACNMCEQSFKSNSDLVRHEESHLEKSYVCSYENCTFSTKTSHCLRRHVRITHSGSVKRYICHICNRAYSRGFGLTKHLKKQHNFSWPSGHPRFRYIEYEDGLYRLQMVRFESVELTKRLQRDGASDVQDYGGEEIVETGYEEEDPDGNQSGDNGKHDISQSGVDANQDVGQTEVIVDEMILNHENEGDQYADQLEDAGDSIVSEAPDGNEISEGMIRIETINPEQLMEVGRSLPVAIETNSNNIPSSSTMLYLQPKPPGYDTSVMSQLIALASNASTDSLLNDIYQQLIAKQSKGNELGNEIDQNTEHSTEEQTIDSKHGDVVVYSTQPQYDVEDCADVNPTNENQPIVFDSIHNDQNDSSGTTSPGQLTYCFAIKASPDSTTSQSHDINIEKLESDIVYLATDGKTCPTEDRSSPEIFKKRKTIDQKLETSIIKRLKENDSANLVSTTTHVPKQDEIGDRLDASQVLLSLKATSK